MDDERRRLLDHILAIDRQFYRLLVQAGFGQTWANVDITMPQLKALLLVTLSDGPSMSQIARSLGVTLSTATGVVDRLVAQGLVCRASDPSDRRLVVIRPTGAGSEVVEQLLQANRECFHGILERLSLDELRTVARAIDILYEAAQRLLDLKATAGVGQRV